ncbi:uncharacterized protein LOC110115692 [Dendrobium catenatum]|uniref:uncharacterized protein LOC110115692 n=1 Tax=Dendrobium catenatum TaxID=906689 RepID=UPI0010A0BAE1|nr:uncharacterized protein LOC110115692 [Dendrobium catenatum]
MYAKEEPGTSPELSPYLDPEPSPKKSRRSVQKRVVSLPVPEAEGPRLKSGGEAAPPPDSWAWRKYGQKPIKGSPYPRWLSITCHLIFFWVDEEEDALFAGLGELPEYSVISRRGFLDLQIRGGEDGKLCGLEAAAAACGSNG